MSKKWLDAAAIAVDVVVRPLSQEQVAEAIKRSLEDFLKSEDGRNALALLTNSQSAVVFVRDFALDGQGRFWTVQGIGKNSFVLDLTKKDMDDLGGLLADTREIGLIEACAGYSAEQIMVDLHANLDKIADQFLQVVQPAKSGELPKQTYPAIGGVATIEGIQFAFPVAAGIGRVMLDGQPALVEFNCQLETMPPQGSGRVLARGEVVVKICDGMPYPG